MKTIWALFAVLFAAFCLIGQSIPMGSSGVGNPIAPWTISNNQINSCTTCTTNLSAPAFSTALTNGSVIVVGSSMFVVSATPQSMSDTAGNTFVQIQNSQWTGGTQILWCANNTHTTASDVVTITTNGGVGPVVDGALNPIELVDANGALDCVTSRDDTKGGSGTASGSTNNAIVSNGMNLSHANDFVYTWGNSLNGNNTAGTSPFAFTATHAQVVTNTFSVGTYYFSPATVNPFNGTWSISGGGGYQSFAIAFKP